MGTVLIKLAAPLQSWGVDGHFVERRTRYQPTKSGLVGLLAAALGKSRTEDISDLAMLAYGVRTDQPGHYEQDFQTAHKMELNSHGQMVFGSKKSDALPVSKRYYLSDAVFVAGIQADDDMLATLADALLHPAFPLFLGRRSCPPACKLLMDVHEGVDLMQALESTPWQASQWYRRTQEKQVELEVMRDKLPNEDGADNQENVHDVPLSFSQEKREYSWRSAVHEYIVVENPDSRRKRTQLAPHTESHDPWAALGKV